MSKEYRELTPRFNSALNKIFSCNLAEKVIIKVTNSTITFFYAVSTAIKDAHRKILKDSYCDQCITNVHNDVTEFKAVFNLNNSVLYIESYFNMISSFTFEIIKNLTIRESTRSFITSIYGDKLKFE